MGRFAKRSAQGGGFFTSNPDLEALRSILAVRIEQLHRLPNVVGTGIGNRRRGGEEVNELCICVSVERKLAKAELRDDELIPVEVSVPGLGSAPTDVVETGRPRLLLDMAKYRPVRGGCLIATGRGFSTLGGIAFDANALEPAFVTCWHALFAPSFFATVGTRTVWQPGAVSTAIGEAGDAAPLQFGQTFDATGPGYNQHPLNPVDAAKGDFRYLGSPPNVEFNVLDIGGAIFELKWAAKDDAVWKHGSGTGLTEGKVVEVDYTLADIPYGGGFYASIGGPGSGCVKIEGRDPLTGRPAPFAGAGDSGSVLFLHEPVVVSSAYPAVGIVFATTGDDPSTTCYACGINAAFSALNLVTVSRGIYLRALRQAQLRQAIFRPVSSYGGVAEEIKRFDELREYARQASEPGRALLDLATAAIPQIADPVYQDPIAFGLFVRLVERFGLQPTVLDILETNIDAEAVDLFRRLLARVERAEPASRKAVSEVGQALADLHDKRIAKVVGVELG
jgi:hypothetical protein